MIDLGEALAQFGACRRSTARPVAIAVVDSGIYAEHPHVHRVAGGISLVPGTVESDFIDRNGHGTAVAAAIREKVPAADLTAVKIFDRTLATTAALLARAIEWAVRDGADVINLSVGTTNAAHADLLQRAVRIAREAGTILVAAAEQAGLPSLPGSLEGVVSVSVDWECPRDACIVDAWGPDALRVRASGYPRPIPGVPVAVNLKGVSFAVANATGLIARALPREG